MIQIIPARKSKHEEWGEAFGNIVGAGLQAYGQHQRNKAEEEEYQRENSTYSKLTGRNLSKKPKIREKEIEYALRGQGEIEKEQRKYKTKSQEIADKLQGEQRIQKELVSFADRLEQNNPDNPSYKALADIYRLDIPLDTKTDIVKSLTGSDPFKADQQNRLMMDSTLKRYNSRLKELDDEIKNVRNPNSSGKEEVDKLRKQRMALRNERDQLLDFRALNGMQEEEFGDEDEVTFADVEEEEDEEVDYENPPKVAFDKNNQKHKGIAEALFKKYKDKEKVRKILRKNFKGL